MSHYERWFLENRKYCFAQSTVWLQFVYNLCFSSTASRPHALLNTYTLFFYERGLSFSCTQTTSKNIDILYLQELSQSWLNEYTSPFPWSLHRSLKSRHTTVRVYRTQRCLCKAIFCRFFIDHCVFPRCYLVIVSSALHCHSQTQQWLESPSGK